MQAGKLALQEPMMSMLMGDQDLPRTGVFSGMIGANARAVSGSDVEMAGMVNGDLIIEPDARVVVSGMVNGRIIDHASR